MNSVPAARASNKLIRGPFIIPSRERHLRERAPQDAATRVPRARGGGVINENPCDQTETPRRDTQERSAVRPSAVRRFVSELVLASEDEFGYFLAVVMGLHRGEVCALSRCDVDDELKALSIRHNFDHFGNLKEPKTHAGLRSLPLSDTICRAFARHREAQREKTAGVASKDGRRTFRQGEDTPIIVNRHGERMNPNTFAAHWRRDREALEAAGFCLHELRHSYLQAQTRERFIPDSCLPDQRKILRVVNDTSDLQV